MNSKLIAILGTAALLMSVGSAQQSFSAEFDANKLVTLEGTGMSKDAAYRANSRDIQFPDGRKLDTGSSYTGGKEEKKG